MSVVYFSKIHFQRYEIIKTIFKISDLDIISYNNKFFGFFFDLFTKKKFILILHPGNYLKFFFYSIFLVIFKKKITIDFYDLHLLRIGKQNIPKIKIILILEIYFIKVASIFFSRSGEINYYRKNNKKLFKNKKIIVLPDINYLEKFSGHNIYNKKKYLVIGGTFIPSLIKFIEINLDCDFTIIGMPEDYKEKFPNFSNITFLDFINFNEKFYNSNVFKEYVGLHFIDLNRNLYRRSACIKYYHYLKLGLNILTDKRHRIARFFSYLYPNRFTFMNNFFENFNNIDTKKLYETDVFIINKKRFNRLVNNLKLELIYAFKY